MTNGRAFGFKALCVLSPPERGDVGDRGAAQSFKVVTALKRRHNLA